MTIVAHSHPYVVGVDTHARTHTFAILAASTGELIATEQFATSPGMDRAIAWAARRTDGDLATLWVIEGVVTYGARLAAAAGQAGYEIVEGRPNGRTPAHQSRALRWAIPGALLRRDICVPMSVAAMMILLSAMAWPFPSPSSVGHWSPLVWRIQSNARLAVVPPPISARSGRVVHSRINCARSAG